MLLRANIYTGWLTVEKIDSNDRGRMVFH
eukprot:SAG31_NODE_39203_length_290_cov_0.811518_1_plen_28_part_10